MIQCEMMWMATMQWCRGCQIFFLNPVCKRTSPDTENHEQNGYAKVYDDKYTFKTNVDNDNSDTTYTDKHKHNMREV